jgi:hypothetical protein
MPLPAAILQALVIKGIKIIGGSWHGFCILYSVTPTTLKIRRTHNKNRKQQ